MFALALMIPTAARPVVPVTDPSLWEEAVIVDHDVQLVAKAAIGPYVSGTNARAKGYSVEGAWVDPPPDYWDSAQCVAFQLKLNGTVVRSYPEPAPVPLPWAAAGNVIFDSTHFSAGSTVTVRVEADWLLWRNGVAYPRSISCEKTATVKNATTLFGRYDMDITPRNSAGDFGPDGWKSLPTVLNYTEAMGYDNQDYVTTLGWTKDNFYDAIEAGSANVVHIHTHGNTTGIWDDQNDYNYPSSPVRIPGWIVGRLPSPYSWPAVILSARQIANGNDLPPLNGSGNPPINLAYVDACETAGTAATGPNNQWGEGFLYPNGNIYVGVSDFPEDQACVCYPLLFKLDYTEDVQDAFYGTLAEGWTVSEAREEAHVAYSGADNAPDDASDFMHIYGDQTTRLKGVYTGIEGQESRWHN